MNPLDMIGQKFELTLRYPKPKFKELKDGPKYIVEFEVTREDWDAFVATDKTGMVIEAIGQVTHRQGNTADEELNQDKPKGGPLSKNAASLCRDRDFWQFLELKAGESVTSEEVAANLLRKHLGINSRAELDHNESAAKQFLGLKRDFIRYQVCCDANATFRQQISQI